MAIEKNNKVRVARQVRPDDICVGEYVSVLCEIYEWPSILCSAEFGAPEVQRVTLVPNETSPPVRIESVCVPFVFAVDARGKHSVIDIRRVRLARVSNGFGGAVFAAMAPKKGRKKGGKRCKKCGGRR